MDCVQAWPLYQLQDMELLKSVQRKAISIVSGLQGIMYEEWLKECGLTTLEDGRLQSDMYQVYKVLGGNNDIHIDDWFSVMDGESQVMRYLTEHLAVRQPKFYLCI